MNPDQSVGRWAESGPIGDHSSRSLASSLVQWIVIKLCDGDILKITKYCKQSLKKYVLFLVARPVRGGGGGGG